MPEHELIITVLFNQFLAGPANSILAVAGLHAEDPAKPWSNWMAMQILVALIIMAVFALLRGKISWDKPGKHQHIWESVYGFLHEQSEEAAGHEGPHYLHLFATLFVFILISNLIGVVPAFESPTMFPPVPLGCALVTFFYYNAMTIKVQGIVGFFKHLCGPVWWLAWLMFPIEIISNAARLLSLTIRLYANLFAGEQVTMVFLSMTYLVVPAVFLGLHVFVSFMQAYIFALMTMIYVGGGIAHDEH